MEKYNRSSLRKLAFLLIIILSSARLFAQPSGRVTGIVTSDDNNPLAGVAVLVKGTQNGTVTDSRGRYAIGASQGDSLVFTSLGFVRKAVLVTAAQLNVSLVSTSSKLNSVVVVAYGTQKKRNVTGSITQLSAAKMQDMPVGQFAQQLQGKVAGLQVQQNNGAPGRGMQFRIRGAASLSTGNQPLIVVDGTPITGSINDINPNDIESFTVLKDASASSLYGSRAANGVILITTKHAKPGQDQQTITLDAYYGVQIVPEKRRYHMMTAREWAQFQNEYYEDKVRYDGFTGTLNPVYANPERYGKGTNWVDTLLRVAPIQRYNLNISSSGKHAAFTMMGGYFNQQGVLLNTGTQVYNLRFNGNVDLADGRLKIGVNLAPSYTKDHNNRMDTEGNNALMEDITESSPLIPPVYPDGTMPRYVNSPGMVQTINPYARLMLQKDDYKTTRFLGNSYLDYEIISGLTLETNVSLDMADEVYNNFIPALISSNNLATGKSANKSQYSWNAYANLTYDKTFFENHHINALIGYSAESFREESNSLNGTNFPSDDIEWLSAATSITSGSSNMTAYSLLSSIARLDYNYKGKYLLSAAYRRDGSSRFGQDRKYGDFPSVSVGWVLSDEPFMKGVQFLDLLKVRGSYGITGNNDIGNYTAISKIGEYNYVLNEGLVPGSTISSLGNPELAWERDKQLDIGLNLEILKGRIAFTYDYYHKISDGLIQARQIPRASGFSSIMYNVGELEFWGHEFAINTVNTTGALKWTSSFNISFDRNIIRHLVDPGFFHRNSSIYSDYYRDEEGHPLGTFYGFIFEGLYNDEADLASSPKYATSLIGTIKFRDVNGDDTITTEDRTFIGDPNPKFTFGFSNYFTYRNFDLNIAISGSVGGKIMDAITIPYLSNLDGARMLISAAKDRWRSLEEPGSGYYPRTAPGTTAIGRAVNTQWVKDGSFLTVKNISLGYTINLPQTFLLKKIRVYGSVHRLLMLTKYTGMNPEVSLDGLKGSSIGIDENAYPVPRIFAVGLTTTFK